MLNQFKNIIRDTNYNNLIYSSIYSDFSNYSEYYSSSVVINKRLVISWLGYKEVKWIKLYTLLGFLKSIRIHER